MRQSVSKALRDAAHRGVLRLQIAILIVAGIAPALMNQSVSAAQLTSRKVTINKSAISSTDVEHAFSYSVPTTGPIQGIMYEFCTTPLGTCTLPSGMAVQAATHDSQTFDQATAFTAHSVTNENDCSMSTNAYKMCFERTAAGNESGASLHTISGITAPNAYLTVYIRISTYNDNDFQTTDLVDTGVVASAYVRQLTVSGRVAERLEFCVAAIQDQEPAVTPTNCAAMPTTTSIAIGTIDPAAIYTTPVEPTSTNASNDYFGAAMVNTNASGGVVVTYFPEAATNVTSSDADQLRSFRVLPTDCNASSATLTDQCFRSAVNTAENFTAGQEKFGMYVPCVDSYGAGGTTINLAADTVYRGTDADATESNSGNAATCQTDEAATNINFAFDDSGTPDTIAASSTVVDDEMIKLGFGATASATTPEGSYLVIITYIATPTF
jgi:hypothetical protein